MSSRCLLLACCSFPQQLLRFCLRCSTRAEHANLDWQRPPDNKWTTIGNWNLGVPASGDTAFFNNGGNSNTTVSLGGASQPINTIEFDKGITPSYMLGMLASGDKFVFDVGGSIIETTTVATNQTINAALQLTNGTITNSGVGLASRWQHPGWRQPHGEQSSQCVSAHDNDA